MALGKRDNIKKQINLFQFVMSVLVLLALPLVYLISRYNYNLFHSLADGISIVIAVCAFTIVWNSRRLVDNDYYLFVGIGFLFFAFVDFFHIIGNRGMNIFPQYGNLGPTFYIVSRYFLAISLAVAPFYIRRRLNITAAFTIYSIAMLLIVLSVFYWKVFPLTIIEGVGLTPFKIISDYVICVILLAAAVLLFINREAFDFKVIRIIASSIVLLILSGLTFTLYTDPFGVTNFVGHLFQIVSFYLFYLAFIETAIRNPQGTLFRKLKKHEETLALNLSELDAVNTGLQEEIAERKRTENALRESEAKYRNLFMNMTEEVHFWKLVRDEEGNIITWRLVDANPPTLKTWGKTLEEIKNRTTDEIFGPGATEHYMAVVRKIMTEGIPYSFEDYFSNLGKHFLFTSVPMGEYFITTGADITLIKEAEESLRRAKDDLELRVRERTSQLRGAYTELEKEVAQRKQMEDHLIQSRKMEAIGTLAGGIAHDFNNMLAGILGFTEMAIEDTQDRPDVQKSLQNVSKAAIRARDLVKQILSFSRRTDHQRSPLSISPIIRETVQLLRASIPSMIDIKLSITATSDMVVASPTEAQQIVMNLATNASLAMQEKGGALEVILTDIDFEPDSPVFGADVLPGEYVQLVVKDTGVGMSPDVMKRVFEPFFTTREVGKGTGMGLAVVYGIVRDLQGTVTVESEPGVGSTFRVFLPKVKTDTLAEAPQSAEIAGGNERILFIDDEEMLVEWGRATLERLGYTVTAIIDGQEALKTFSSDPSLFDLVITDHAMPQIAGAQLAEELLRVRADIPVILCTGHSNSVDPETVKAAGIREFLIKPLTKQELAAAVRRALDRKSAT